MPRINTRQYEFSHAKKPRGYGLWLFSAEGRAFDSLRREPDEHFSHTGTYTDAAAAARAWAREHDHEDIVVLP